MSDGDKMNRSAFRFYYSVYEIILTSNSNVYFAMSTDVGDALLESEKGIW